jgi:hypothetical protein
MIPLAMLAIALGALIVAVIALWRLDKLFDETNAEATVYRARYERMSHLVEGLQDELSKTNDLETSVSRIQRSIERLQK